MNERGPFVKGNPLKISVFLLVVCYFTGEFIFPKYPMIYFINLIGIIGLIISIIIFFLGFNTFKSYEENPTPKSFSIRLIKTGIFAYTRNPIYLSFVLFHFNMFIVFENVMYFLASIGLSIWMHNYVIKPEEKYLLNKFKDEYVHYKEAVSRWIFF